MKLIEVFIPRFKTYIFVKLKTSTSHCLGTEGARNFCAGIGPLLLGVVLALCTFLLLHILGPPTRKKSKMVAI